MRSPRARACTSRSSRERERDAALFLPGRDELRVPLALGGARLRELGGRGVPGRALRPSGVTALHAIDGDLQHGARVNEILRCGEHRRALLEGARVERAAARAQRMLAAQTSRTRLELPPFTAADETLLGTLALAGNANRLSRSSAILALLLRLLGLTRGSEVGHGAHAEALHARAALGPVAHAAFVRALAFAAEAMHQHDARPGAREARAPAR